QVRLVVDGGVVGFFTLDVNGHATAPVPGLHAGNHSLNINYMGSTNFAPYSTSPATGDQGVMTVNRATPLSAITMSPPAVHFAAAASGVNLQVTPNGRRS